MHIDTAHRIVQQNEKFENSRCISLINTSFNKCLKMLVQRKKFGSQPTKNHTWDIYISPFNSLLLCSGELVGGLDQILVSHASTILQLLLESTMLHPFHAKISMDILHNVLCTFSVALTSRKKLWGNNQECFKFEIISLILMSLMFDSAVIHQC